MTLKLFPPLVTRMLWPLFNPIWKRFGVVSVADMMKRCGMTGELQGLGGCLSYLYGDYGVKPSKAPWYLHTVVATHYDGGAFFPTGGSSRYISLIRMTLLLVLQ